ncbi:Rhomboid protease GlpG [Gimesia alba]|uniref:Rhomboid protease GlpG n=1 Tax=Gimesia alba TaxID=2527973 RepID=A0A517RFR1_9PLAN|nr:rhomboid family intramembrane serine protease [Gimesia alba]QDT42707.1 Rhomboid protease GlpG [Gimesia alba]
MRKIGSLESEQQARHFADYLLTQGVDINVETSGDQWSVWVLDEDQVEQSKAELAEFSRNPEAEKYLSARLQANEIRDARIKKVREDAKKRVDVRETWNRPFTSRCPVTSLLIGVSIVVFLFMQSNEYENRVRQALSICTFKTSGNMISYDTRLMEVRDGEVWRLVTPIFIHFGVFHILFNSIMTYQLGGAIEMNRGSTRLALLVLVTAIPSNLAQFYWSGPGFGGLSGVVYGMFGYMWMKSQFDPRSTFYIPPNMVFILIGWFFLCMTGLVGNVANLAHGFGLVTGMVIGIGSSFLRQAGKSR